MDERILDKHKPTLSVSMKRKLEKEREAREHSFYQMGGSENALRAKKGVKKSQRWVIAGRRVGVLMDFDDMVDEFSRRKARNKPKGHHWMLQGPSI